jgi:glycosidase
VRFDGVDTGLDTLFDFPLMYSARRVFAEGKPVKELAQMLSQDQLYTRPGVLVTVLGNHDLQRFMSEPGATIAGLNLAHTFIMTIRGTPQIYYGDELAMAGGGDPDNRGDFQGGFPGDGRNAFTTQGRTSDQQAAFDHLRRLAHLRAENEPLRGGALVNLYVADQQYVYARVNDRDSVVVVINNDDRLATVEFSVASARLADGATLRDLMGVASPITVVKGTARVAIPARAAAIFSRK